MNPQQSLRAFFTEGFQRMYLADARPRTVAEYRYSVAAWTKIHGELPLAAITTEHMADFRAKLALRAGRIDARAAAATVNKHVRHINALLGKAGPPGPRNRDALELIARAPWIKQLRIQLELPRFIPLEQLAAVYDRCDAAAYPADCHPAPYWRSLIAAAWFTMYRRRLARLASRRTNGGPPLFHRASLDALLKPHGVQDNLAIRKWEAPFIVSADIQQPNDLSFVLPQLAQATFGQERRGRFDIQVTVNHSDDASRSFEIQE